MARRTGTAVGPPAVGLALADAPGRPDDPEPSSGLIPRPVPGPPSVGAGVAVLDGRSVGSAVGAALGLGRGRIVGRGVDRGSTVGASVGAGVAVGRGVGRGVGAGVGLGVGFGVGSGVGSGVGLGVGLGVGGGLMVTVPAPSLSSKRSRLIASNTTSCVPTGSLPVQRKRTSRFQSPSATRAIGWVDPATCTRTQFAGEPSRLR